MSNNDVSPGGRDRANNANNRPAPRRRKPGKPRSSQGDVWRTPAPLPDVVPIETPKDVSALLRSLGDLPVHGGTAIGHYASAVAERAAAVAVALALSVDLLAHPSTDDDTTPWTPTATDTPRRAN
jgi:hypothetical protein